MAVLETLLLACCRRPDSPAVVGEQEWHAENALSLLARVFPDLTTAIWGRRVLDFGCGFGYQVVALADAGADAVVGLEPNVRVLAEARRLAATAAHRERVSFIAALRPVDWGAYDVVLSQNSMEHFPRPDLALKEMRSLLRPGGRIYLTFGPPWLAPYGAHMWFFTPLPWVHLLFPERTVMRVRGRFRRDGAVRYEDVESGLNRLTVARFERLVESVGLRVIYRRYDCIKGLNALGRLPLARELFINHVSAVLRAD